MAELWFDEIDVKLPVNSLSVVLCSDDSDGSSPKGRAKIVGLPLSVKRGAAPTERGFFLGDHLTVYPTSPNSVPSSGAVVTSRELSLELRRRPLVLPSDERLESD